LTLFTPSNLKERFYPTSFFAKKVILKTIFSPVGLTISIAKIDQLVLSNSYPIFFSDKISLIYLFKNVRQFNIIPQGCGD